MKSPTAKKSARTKRGRGASPRSKSSDSLNSLDLAGRSSKELKKLKDKIEQRLVSQQSTFLKEAYARMQEIADEYDTTVEAVVKFNRTGRKGKRKAAGKKTVGKPKYRNPGDPSQTWTGRGKRPGWFVDAVSKGASPESLEI